MKYKPKDELVAMVLHLLDLATMSDWEDEFISSLYSNTRFTEKQEKKIRELHNKYFDQ